MSEKEIGNIPQIARGFINHLPKEFKEMEDKLKELIARAEGGQDTTIEIINLLSSHEITREWMKEQINLKSREKGVLQRFDPLAGDLKLALPSQKWICPEESCDNWVFMIQAGGDPPTCEKHNVRMIRVE